MQTKQLNQLYGEVTIPGDKSISHRGVMFGALANGTTRITNFLTGADCLSTISCFQKMGIAIESTPSEIIVHGKGLHGLSAASSILDVGNSGTTTRLISGILSGQNFTSHLDGDASIRTRPMGRIMNPLTEMGANIKSDLDNGCAPLTITPGQLHGIHYNSPVASAQVKSCILLAGLYADGKTTVTEPFLSRNHTELMLGAFGADLKTDHETVSICPDPYLTAQDIAVPGDISSAAYFIAAALLVPGSEVLIKNVGINPTRTGILEVCQQMNANIEILNKKTAAGEPVADLLVRSSSLKGCIIEGEVIPRLIDEIPMIAIMAACASGTTIIRDAAELKVKESDRIAVMVDNLSRMGVDITGTDDGMIIHGGSPLKGAAIKTYDDHRIAMSFTVAGLISEGDLTLDNPQCVNISYPTFYKDIESLMH